MSHCMSHCKSLSLHEHEKVYTAEVTYRSTSTFLVHITPTQHHFLHEGSQCSPSLLYCMHDCKATVRGACAPSHVKCGSPVHFHNNYWMLTSSDKA